MFATTLGGLPRPPLPDKATIDDLVEAIVLAQEAAGLEPITDGWLRGQDDLAGGWAATQRLTDRAVKQALTGPYTWGRATRGSPGERSAATLGRAATLNQALRQLASAGCPLIEIHEPAAVSVGSDPGERALFREAHLRLLDGVDGVHRTLALTGGNADVAGIETLLAARYESLAVDLIAGPDNWRLVAATPGDRGIVLGALPVAPGSDDGPETLLWAVDYAASTRGRGRARIGLATASSLAHLTWEVALRKLERLGEAARLADRPRSERFEALDPRGVSSRSAALGRVDPSPRDDPSEGQEPS